MKNNRRDFIKMATMAGGSAAILTFASFCSVSKFKDPSPDYSALEKFFNFRF